MVAPPQIKRDDDDPMGIGSDPRFVLPRLVEGWYERDPDRPFLHEVETGRGETYGSFRDLTRRWARVLRDAGVGHGDRVVSFLPSSIDAHGVWIATSLIGATEIPVDPGLPGELLRHALERAGASVAVMRADQQSIVLDSGVPVRMITTSVDASPADLVGAEDVDRLPTPTDASCVIFTSGTSGPAKGVVISWGQMATTIGRIPRSWLSDADAAYSPWPMFHVTGRSPMFAMADVGGRVVLRERFSLRSFWEDIDRHRCTVTTAGAVAGLLLDQPPDDADRHHALVHAFLGSGPIALAFTERFGVNGIACYGTTELGFPIANPRLTRETAAGIGWLRPGYAARIVDAHDADVADGVPGELLVRPPHRRLIMTGYLDEPEHTAAAVEDGWYRTGDVVLRDADGSFRFVDRLRDTIRRFGENISSKQLESIVLGDDAVADCAAIGVPSAIGGQAVLLCVVPRDETEFDVEELAARLARALPRYMRPEHIAIRTALPRTPNGKVRKQLLRDEIDLREVWSPAR